MTKEHVWTEQLIDHLRAHESEIRRADLSERIHADLVRSAVMSGQFTENLVRRFVMDIHEQGFALLSVTPVHYRHWRRPGAAHADEVFFPLGEYTTDLPTGLESRDQVEARIEALVVPIRRRAIPEAD